MYRRQCVTEDYSLILNITDQAYKQKSIQILNIYFFIITSKSFLKCYKVIQNIWGHMNSSDTRKVLQMSELGEQLDLEAKERRKVVSSLRQCWWEKQYFIYL